MFHSRVIDVQGIVQRLKFGQFFADFLGLFTLFAQIARQFIILFLRFAQLSSEYLERNEAHELNKVACEPFYRHFTYQVVVHFLFRRIQLISRFLQRPSLVTQFLLQRFNSSLRFRQCFLQSLVLKREIRRQAHEIRRQALLTASSLNTHFIAQDAYFAFR